MTLKAKYEYRHEDILRDARPWTTRFIDGAKDPENAIIGFTTGAVAMLAPGSPFASFADVIFLIHVFYFWWFMTRPLVLPFKLPRSANRKDPNNKKPDGTIGMADGILYLGNNNETGEEIWFTNNDARTHCLYLGTTGSGKTFGLKSYACNALCWSSGFIYIDGKADTDLWSTLSAMGRRFGRDDDILIMNYMTGNVSGARVPSNTLNPFSSGSSSYLTNMLVSLMPDAEGDNAMWKERAVALVSALMPCLVWKRDNQNIPLSIGTIRQFLTFKSVIKLSRDSAVPEHMRAGIRGYLNELPGYVDNVFDDEGNEKPMPPDAGAVDTSVPRQQHGYLSMQFTRSMQSLGDDYGFIFDTQAADIDMMDVVLNRRILVVLIPALEKSSDETANLGKIIASTLKGMMGATLGNTVEGDTATAIDNKPTNSSTPFIAIFDEVGYYTAQGMAVMAAQARSLGFSLVFAGQDLPALEKRVKEEARSITANCNIKLFGKLEDPTQTKEFFEKTVGQAIVTEVSGFQRGSDVGGQMRYMDSQNASVQVRARASYDGLKGFTEGRAICAFGKAVNEIQIYNSDIGHAKAMRVHRFLPVPPPAEDALESLRSVDQVLQRFRNPHWKAEDGDIVVNRDIEALAQGFTDGRQAQLNLLERGIMGVGAVAASHNTIKPSDAQAAVETAPASTPAAIPASVANEAKKIAASAVTQTITQTLGGKGPLSWADLIGTASGAEAVPLERKEFNPLLEDDNDEDDEDETPELVAKKPAEPATDDKKPLTWDSIMGTLGGGAAPPAATQKTPPPLMDDDDDADDEDDEEDEDSENKETAAGGSSDQPSMMTWADIIGGGTSGKQN